jgi:hypothetical protein
MTVPAADERTAERRTRDEQIAAEPYLAPPQLPPGSVPTPVETHLHHQRRQPLAIAGIVENGLVRPLDPAVRLTEHSRVIIVAESS